MLHTQLTGGVFIVSSFVNLSVKPGSSEFPPTAIMPLYKLCAETHSIVKYTSITSFTFVFYITHFCMYKSHTVYRVTEKLAVLPTPITCNGACLIMIIRMCKSLLEIRPLL